MNKYILMLLLVCKSLSLQAIIVEHNTIDAIFDYIDTPNTLVVFDIDNTIATSKFEIGGDAWFSYLVGQKQKEGYTFQEAIHLALPTYFHVAFDVPLVPVESTTPHVIKQLHDQKIPTLSLTSRSIYIADRTLAQLQKIDIHFSIPQIKQNEMSLQTSTHVPSIYKKGIIFSGNNNKGEMLLEFFKATNYYPMKVIFLDDKRKYVEQLETVLEKKAIPYIGIRYGACDERVKNFNPAKAEREFAEFKSGLLQKPKQTTVFSYICNCAYSMVKCFIPS